MSKIFAGPLGSFLKAFITAMLTLFVAKYNEGVLCVDTACLKDVVLAALFATLPVIINYLNPNYNGYGVKNN
jgi:ABC-type Fe3+-siderophore transport system permease subunit